MSAEERLGTAGVAHRPAGADESQRANRAWWDADADDYLVEVVDAFSQHVTKDLVEVLQALVILFVAVGVNFRWLSNRFSLLRRSKI